MLWLFVVFLLFAAGRRHFRSIRKRMHAHGVRLSHHRALLRPRRRVRRRALVLLLLVSLLATLLVHLAPVAKMLSPALECTLQEFWTGASWKDPSALSRKTLSRRVARPRGPGQCDGSSSVKVKVLRWTYQDAKRYPTTDSQLAPLHTAQCQGWCNVADLFLADGSWSPASEIDADLVLLSPHDHGR
jgi:hypothetical protein